MPIRPKLSALVITLLALAAPPAIAQDIQVYENASPEQMALGSYAVPGGKTLELSVGIGSSLYHVPGDPPDRFWALSDRGPNIACGDAEDIMGVDGKSFCAGIKQGRVYPRPDYAPAIFEVALDRARGTFSVVQTIPIKRTDGTPVTGLPNPLTKASTETPLDGEGHKLATDPAALDTEALVRLPDGTFWIGEENAPSILHVTADGTIVRRYVPQGAEGDFAAAGYPVEGTLPAILSRRQLNRGVESLALDGDGFLWAVLQNPLANPDADAFRAAANARILKLERATGRPVAEYVYTLEPMANFPGETDKAQSTARISELAHVAGTKFLIDDRTDKTTRILLIDVEGATDILGSRWDDPATTPALEQTDLGAAGISPVSKELVLDSSKLPQLPGKIEGMTLIDGVLYLVNDDDFGIEGARTKLVSIEGLPVGN